MGAVRGQSGDSQGLPLFLPRLLSPGRALPQAEDKQGELCHAVVTAHLPLLSWPSWTASTNPLPVNPTPCKLPAALPLPAAPHHPPCTAQLGSEAQRRGQDGLWVPQGCGVQEEVQGGVE